MFYRLENEHIGRLVPILLQLPRHAMLGEHGQKLLGLEIAAEMPDARRARRIGTPGREREQEAS